LPSNAPQGLCPRCLARAAIDLGSPAPGAVSESGSQAGKRIGRYKLLQQIGEGGCGVVYMAEQEEPVQRRVALKIIKLGMDTRQVIARFEAERQAVAMMDHPNIAKVLDAGATANSRPYFVMELVRGIKLTDYCDQNNLPTQQRLELFLQVCKAIQHAHQKGIIHRDIKPSNILVTLHDGIPVPKVIDFGIAKATQGKLTDQTLFTAFEQFMGTPAYMSPEQAEMSGLDIDTRSDIYSLGVLLYELLTGETPFDTKELLALGLDEMRRTIREKEPARPSTRLSTMVDAALTATARHRQIEPIRLASLIRGDLDWIVMKALEKDRTRRYETASGLALDVERFLKNEPVSARPPSTLYRLQKAAHRHRVAFAGASAVAVSLIIGLSLSMWLYFRQHQAFERAVVAEREQRRLRQEAEREKSKAEREEKRSRQVAYYLENTLGDIAPSLAKKCTKPYVQEVLSQADKRIDAELREQPDVEAVVRTVLAAVQKDMGQLADAELNLTKVLSINRRLYGNQHPEVGIALAKLVELLCAEDKRDQAEPLAREAIGILEHLGADRSNNVDRLSDRRLSQTRLASLPVETNAFESALNLVREATQTPTLTTALDDIKQAQTCMTLGAMLERAGRLDFAATEYRRALDICEQAMAKYPQHPTLEGHRDKVRSELASVLSAQGKFSEVEALLKQTPSSAPPRPEEKADPTQKVLPVLIFDQVPLTVAIRNLATQTGLHVSFDPRVTNGAAAADGHIAPEPSVNLRLERVTANQAMALLLSKYKLTLVEDAQSHAAALVKPVEPLSKNEEPDPASTFTGKPVPQAFTLQLLSGGEIQLPPATNHGPILLDFFTSWCGPCRLTTPIIAHIARQYSGQGVRYVAVNCWGEPPEAVRGYLSRAKLEIPVALDVKQAMTGAFKVDAVPKIVLVDGSDRIRYVHVGATPELADDLRRALDDLLSTQPVSAKAPTKVEANTPR